MKEWIITLTAIILIFLISQYLKKIITPKLKPTTKLIISFGWFICLMTLVIATDIRKNNFTKPELFVLVAFSIGYTIYFYFKYKKLNSSTKITSVIHE